MRTREGSRRSARLAPSFRSIATMLLVAACLVVGFSATVALAVPAAPVVSGPSAIQFAYHPAGFRATFNWDPIPTAVEYQVYNADTLVHLGSVPGTSCVVYGMQGVQYHYRIVAVDSTGATSTPSNIVNIKTTAPPAPAPPVGFEILPSTVFGVQSSTAPAGALPIKIPYDPFTVDGDAADLRVLRYDAGSWTDITTSVDTTGNFVLGLSAPSPVFAVMEANGSAVCTITPSAGTHGSIVPDAPLGVVSGADSPTFTITPDAGYHISDVQVDGVSVGAVSTYVFRSVTSGHVIHVSFAADAVNVTTHTTLSGPGTVRARRTVHLTGWVLPLEAPGSVTVAKQYLVGGRWVEAGTTTVPVYDGRYRYDFVSAKYGTWRLVATYSGGTVGNTSYLPSTTSGKIITVR